VRISVDRKRCSVRRRLGSALSRVLKTAGRFENASACPQLRGRVAHYSCLHTLGSACSFAHVSKMFLKPLNYCLRPFSSRLQCWGELFWSWLELGRVAIDLNAVPRHLLAASGHVGNDWLGQLQLHLKRGGRGALRPLPVLLPSPQQRDANIFWG
jgi:hypothetical protein